MVEFKVVIGDPKTGKSYQKVVSDDSLKSKKIGDKIDGSLLGLEGYELEITGGSDDSGFPMRPDLAGTEKKKLLLSGGVGVKTGFRKKKEKGLRIKKTVAGNTVDDKTVQINVKVVKEGKKSVADLLAPKEEAPAEAPQEEAKTEEKPKEEAKPEEKKEEAPKEKPAEEKKPEEKPKKEEGNE